MKLDLSSLANPVRKVKPGLRRGRGGFLVFCKSAAEAQRVAAFLKADRAKRGGK
jgi:hypothetical protein